MLLINITKKQGGITMKKKIVSLMMATTLVAGLLSGCGGNSAGGSTNTNAGGDTNVGGDTNAGADTNADANAGDAAGADGSAAAAGLPAMTTEEITLTYMHFDSEQLVNRVAEAFMAKYPNIKVEAQAFSTDGYNDTLLNLVQSGQTPDCFMILGN